MQTSCKPREITLTSREPRRCGSSPPVLSSITSNDLASVSGSTSGPNTVTSSGSAIAVTAAAVGTTATTSHGDGSSATGAATGTAGRGAATTAGSGSDTICGT